MEELDNPIHIPRPFFTNSSRHEKLQQSRTDNFSCQAISSNQSTNMDAYNHSVQNTRNTLSSKPNHKILLMGKTGSGKTTTINMIMNLLFQNDYESERKIAITQKIQFTNQQSETILKCNIPEFQHLQSDNMNVSVINSQTSKCMIYPVSTQDYDISFIDTPGLGDTEGTQVDELNIKNMIAQIQQLSEITCVLYIHKQSDLRKDLYLQYYINALKQMLPKKYEDNFVVCFTNVFNPIKIDAYQTLNELGIPLKNYIYLENDCLAPIDIIPYDDTDVKAAAIINFRQYWKINRKQFDKLIQTISPMKSQKTSLMLDLYCKKQAIVRIALQKQHQIEEIQLQKENTKVTQSSIQRAKFNFEQIEIIEDVMRKELKVTQVQQSQKTISQRNCCNLCHNPCCVAEIQEKENEEGKEIRQKEEQIENDLLIIAYLLQQIKESSMNFNNEIVIDYIKEQIQMTKDNSKLEIKDKAHKLQFFQQQLDQYLVLKDTIEQFSKQQKVYSKTTPQLDRQIKEILEKEIQEVMQSPEIK